MTVVFPGELVELALPPWGRAGRGILVDRTPERGLRIFRGAGE